MKLKTQNQLLLTLSVLFILLLVILNGNNAFFWDTVQLGSLHANYYYTTGFSEFLLPDDIDSGHIPAFGMYIALLWKIFGRSLLASHLAMLPFAIGIVFQLSKLTKTFTINKYWGIALILCLIDPTLLSQMTLVSPDVPLVFFFLLAVNAVLKNNKRLILISIVFLFLTSMRGMMVSLAILSIDIYCNIDLKNKFKRIIIDLLTRSILYIPSLLIFILFSTLHYYNTGWIGYHADSPWAESFETVNFQGFIYNIGILGWRILDFGRIGLWLLFFILFIPYRKSLLKDSKTRFLLFFFIVTLILTSSNMLWAKGLLGHRYLIPVYLSFSLLCANILFSPIVKNKLKYTLVAFWGIMIICGNFWIYPPKISQGWDSTLAHLPYYELRNEAITYLKDQNIDFKQVGSFFPNKGSLDAIDLNNDPRKFSDYNGHNKYIFYSNVFNIDDAAYETLLQDYDIIQKFKHNGVYVILYKKTVFISKIQS